jgi:drug/metabolite transporter (DMT)-like permease
MLVVTLLWSTAGVVTRQLESAGSFEITFWRSFFTALSLGLYFAVAHGRDTLRLLLAGGRPLWLSGLMWSVMFTCFMLALTLTTVANVLVTMSVAPLFTALLARFMLGQRIARGTWLAIAVAGVGIGWMYGHGLSSNPRHLLGSVVALGVPIAAAINWNTLQRSGRTVDLVPALLIGAMLSSAAALPLSLPWQATSHDIAWLGLLGMFQLAIPCVIAVRLARSLAAPEISLLALLEIVFGIAWAWIGAGEVPRPQVLVGGAIVLGTLALNEAMAVRRSA